MARPARPEARSARPASRSVPAPGPEGVRASDSAPGAADRRRASRSLWQACEALLAAGAEPRRLELALESLRASFGSDGVALHVVGPSGALDPWCATGRWQIAPGDLRDCLTVPLLRGAARIGSLSLLARPGERWSSSQLGLVRTAAGALGAALGVRRELERLRNQPGSDPDTGLPDERAFQARLDEELGRARQYGIALSVGLVELDHFAALTSRYGRTVAAAVLAEAALVLRLALRDGDVLARVDGGRFAVLLAETEGAAAARCADRVRRAVDEHAFARVGRVSATAGVASCPRDGMDAVELWGRVEQALTLARKGGRRRVAAPAPVNVQ